MDVTPYRLSISDLGLAECDFSMASPMGSVEGSRPNAKSTQGRTTREVKSPMWGFGEGVTFRVSSPRRVWPFLVHAICR